ncbi:MAG: hypothetical protein R6T87_06200, partial [Marinobacter sp.]
MKIGKGIDPMGKTCVEIVSLKNGKIVQVICQAAGIRKLPGVDKIQGFDFHTIRNSSTRSINTFIIYVLIIK